jgi:hypothetical protein
VDTFLIFSRCSESITWPDRFISTSSVIKMPALSHVFQILIFRTNIFPYFISHFSRYFDYFSVFNMQQ